MTTKAPANKPFPAILADEHVLLSKKLKLNTSTRTKNMKRRLTIYNTLAYVFLGCQIISYLGNAASNYKLPQDQAERMGYYFGLNIFWLIAGIFFIAASEFRKKIKKADDHEKIDSIGKGI